MASLESASSSSKGFFQTTPALDEFTESYGVHDSRSKVCTYVRSMYINILDSLLHLVAATAPSSPRCVPFTNSRNFPDISSSFRAEPMMAELLEKGRRFVAAKEYQRALYPYDLVSCNS